MKYNFYSDSNSNTNLISSSNSDTPNNNNSNSLNNNNLSNNSNKKNYNLTEEQFLSLLSTPATSRYHRLVEYHPTQASKIRSYITNMYNNNNIKSIISEDEFVRVSKVVNSQNLDKNIKNSNSNIGNSSSKDGKVVFSRKNSFLDL